MAQITSSIESWNCENQRVFVRADLNVPLLNASIENDRRLQGARKTLDTLIAKKAIIVLATHIGRPKKPTPQLSTQVLLPWFERNGYTVRFCKDLTEAKNITVEPGTIILLENLRFFEGEKSKDPDFVATLKSLAEWYVNDAFATLHRDDASITHLAYSFARDKRSIGYLVQDELKLLHDFVAGDNKPRMAILGGGKVTDKLPVIENLLDTVDHILLCPALVFTFLKAIEKPVGKSYVDESLIAAAKEIIEKANEYPEKLIFPLDYQIAKGSLDGDLSIVTAEEFPNDGLGVSIGAKTNEYFNSYIAKSGSIFYNGMMGFPDRPETLDGVKQLFRNISNARATSIIAGGNSIAIADQMQLDGITYYSTGGGSTLYYLSGRPLVGLAPFL